MFPASPKASLVEWHQCANGEHHRIAFPLIRNAIRKRADSSVVAIVYEVTSASSRHAATSPRVYSHQVILDVVQAGRQRFELDAVREFNLKRISFRYILGSFEATYDPVLIASMLWYTCYGQPLSATDCRLTHPAFTSN